MTWLPHFDRSTYSGNSRRRFLMNGRPEVNRGAPRFTGGLQVLRWFCYTLLIRHGPNYFFHLANIHHDDGVPRASIQETSVRPLAHAFLPPDAEDWVHLDAAKRQMILIRHPKHAIFHRAIFHTCGRTRATRAAFGDHRKFFRFFLTRGSDPLGTRLVLQCVGDHPGDASGFGLGSHGRIIASLSAICNNHSEVEPRFSVSDRWLRRLFAQAMPFRFPYPQTRICGGARSGGASPVLTFFCHSPISSQSDATAMPPKESGCGSSR